MEHVIELLEKREEYFDGLTYYAGMDRLKICKDVEQGIREYLRGRKALSKEMEQYQLRQIENWEDDLNKLFAEWHLHDEETEVILSVLKAQKEVKIYCFGEDLSYFVTGNITNYFRWIQIVDKWYVLTFELYD